MTTKEKLEEIRLVCIEVNPEIVELKSGCWFDIGGERKIIMFPDGVSQEGRSFLANDNILYSRELLLLSKNIRIIGRSITLPDILMAFDVALERIRVTERGFFMELDDQEDEQFCFSRDGELVAWDLHRGVDGQDDFTIDFIHQKLIKA